MRRILGMALAIGAMLILLAAPAWADGTEGFGGGDTGYPIGGDVPVTPEVADTDVAFTGTETVKWVIAAGALIGVGGALVVADRRRRRLALQ